MMIRKLIAACLLAFLAVRGLAADIDRDTQRDAYLEGYLSAVLEQDLQLPPETYAVEAVNGTVVVYLLGDMRRHEDRIRERFRDVQAVSELRIAGMSERLPAEEKAEQQRWRDWLGVNDDVVALPDGPLFIPTLADPKTPRFFIAPRYYDSDFKHNWIGAVGYGENFGFLRWPGASPDEGLQFGMDGVLLAQFDLEAESMDLLNADYLVGLHLDWRRRALSARFRVFHQSSHLGDEFILNNNVGDRENVSYEAVELLGAWSGDHWRGYLGGIYKISRNPDDIGRESLRAGLEYYGPPVIGGLGRWVAGLDLLANDEQSWAVNTSLKGGLEFSRREATGRNLRILLELYEGYLPHGQFYDQRAEYAGLALELGL